MKYVTRQKGDRRWDLPHDFPLVDSQGMLVTTERRRLPDRRSNRGDLDNLLAILLRMLPGRGQ
jgi:hypothetical protein